MDINGEELNEKETSGIAQEKIIQIIPAQPGWHMVVKIGEKVLEEPIACWALVELIAEVPNSESHFNRLPIASNIVSRSQKYPRRYVKAMCRVGGIVQLDEFRDCSVRYLGPGESIEKQVPCQK